MSSKPEPAPRDPIVPYLEKVLASPGFSGSERMRQLLAYLVDREVAGEGEQLKEATIGVAVWGRSPDFDPKADPVVRVEARRLRSKLEQYYDAEGASDPLRITIPKGQYRPVFHYVDVAAQPLIAPAAPAAALPRRIWRRFGPVAAALIVLAAVLFATRNLSPDANRIALHTSPVTSYPGKKAASAISPDGTRIAFSWADGDRGDTHIYVKGLQSDAPPLQLTHTGFDDLPAWSPDSNWIAFVRNQGAHAEVYAVPAAGGLERKVADNRGRAMAWTPDGYIAMLPRDPTDHGLVLISAQDGSHRYLQIAHNGEVRHMAFSPDGSRIAILECDRGCDIFVAPLGKDRVGDLRQVTQDGTLIGNVVWSPNSRALIYHSAKGGVRKLWKTTLAQESTEQVPVSDLLMPGVEDAYLPTAAAEGDRYMKVLYLHERVDDNIWRIPLAPGSEPARTLIASTRAEHNPRYSPDGQRISFISDRNGSRELFVADRDGSHPVQWTRFASPDANDNEWSPDGRRIVMSSISGSNYRLYLVEGPDKNPVPLTDGSSSDFRPNWSRDGRNIYFGSNRTGTQEIWRMNPDGSDPQRVTFAGGFEAKETADGRYLVVQNDRGLWRMALPSGKPVLLTPNALNGYWDVVGDDVYFLDFGEATLASPMRDTTHGKAQICRLTVATGTIARLRSIETNVWNESASFSVSPDGRYILLGQIDREDSDFFLIEHIPQ